MVHHPHVHCIVPGGGLSQDRTRWIRCKPGYFLPAKVLSRLFRRLLLTQLVEAYQAGELNFYGHLRDLADPQRFQETLAPLRKIDWYVHAKAPFCGPEAVLAYLSRYTHRVAIANSRLITMDDQKITFRVKDYRCNKVRYQPMTLTTDEFIRRFLLHVLPSGFHRIRHYGLFASHVRRKNLTVIRQHLNAEPPPGQQDKDGSDNERCAPFVCHTCGAPMRIVGTFCRKPRAPP